MVALERRDLGQAQPRRVAYPRPGQPRAQPRAQPHTRRRVPSREITHAETRPADAREAAALALAPGALASGALAHGVEGVSLAEGAPLAAFRSAFPAARFPGLPQALRETGSITAALRACGLPDYTRAATRISAHAARPAPAARLRIAAGAPILRPVAVNVDADGAPVEYGVTWFAGERVTLTVAPEGCAAPRGRAIIASPSAVAVPLPERRRSRVAEPATRPQSRRQPKGPRPSPPRSGCGGGRLRGQDCAAGWSARNARRSVTRFSSRLT